MDMQEFQEFYQGRFGIIYRYVYSKVGNKEEAEDLTAEIFLKAMRSIDQERSLQTISYWLYRIMRTMLADYWRVYYRESTDSLDELLEAGWKGLAEKEPPAINCIAAHRVQHLLQALPEQYREVLICRFLLNLTIKATALKLGLTETNVKVLQYRALKRAADLEQATEAALTLP